MNLSGRLVLGSKTPSWEQFQCFTPLEVLPHSTQKKKITKKCIENSTKKWMHRWCNDLCSCKIWGCTNFVQGREKKDIGIWIGAGYGSIWIVHPTQLIYPFYLFCFSLHGILFNPKFCMNIDPCIIYASTFFVEFFMYFCVCFRWSTGASQGVEALKFPLSYPDSQKEIWFIDLRVHQLHSHIHSM